MVIVSMRMKRVSFNTNSRTGLYGGIGDEEGEMEEGEEEGEGEGGGGVTEDVPTALKG